MSASRICCARRCLVYNLYNSYSGMVLMPRPPNFQDSVLQSSPEPFTYKFEAYCLWFFFCWIYTVPKKELFWKFHPYINEIKALLALLISYSYHFNLWIWILFPKIFWQWKNRVFYIKNVFLFFFFNGQYLVKIMIKLAC